MAVRIHTHCTRPGKGMGRKSNNSLVESPTKHSVRTCRMHPGILSPHTNCAGGWNILDDYLIERLSISKETEGEKMLDQHTELEGVHGERQKAPK